MNHRDARVFHLLAVLQEDKRVADVQNNTLCLLVADVSYFVAMADFRSVIVDCSCKLFSLNLIADLWGGKGYDRAILVEQVDNISTYFNDATDCSRAKYMSASSEIIQTYCNLL